MIDFSTLQGLTIPEGVVTQIADASGRVLWAVSGGKVVLEVEKITADTYAGETTYTAEEFILLDIYPKTNGTVTVTYGGLTKTITDTSGAEEPNAQEVFFGTFNGVSDSMETPASGELTIEGDYYAFACGGFNKAKLGYEIYYGITAITNFGEVTTIPTSAFGYYMAGRSGIPKITEVNVPNGVERIGTDAFGCCSQLTKVIIPTSVKSIGKYPFYGCDRPNFVEMADNSLYKIDGNCLIEISTNKLIQGFEDSVIPSYVTNIDAFAFSGYTRLSTITIPTSVTSMVGCFSGCENLTIIMLSTIPPTLDVSSNALFSTSTDNVQIIVPKGCGETYKSAEGWSIYRSYIVEEA